MMGVSAATVRRIIPVAYVVLLVSYLGIPALSLPPTVAAFAGQTILALVVCVACYVLIQGFVHTTGSERRFWGFVSLGAGFLALGRAHDLIAALLALSGGGPVGMWSAVFDVGAVVTFLTLLLAFSRFRHTSMAARIRYVIDIAAVSVAIAGALEILVIGPWFDHLGISSVWFRFVYSASPVVGALALGGMFVVVLGTRFDRWEPWERVLAGSAALLAAGLVLAPVAYADITVNLAGGWARSISDALWMTGVYLGMAGAVYRHIEGERPWRIRPLATLEPSYGWLPTVVLPSVAVIALPLFGWAAANAADPQVRLVRLVVFGALALTVAARTLLTVMEQDALTTGVVTDPLTGLFNHTHYQTLLSQEIAHATRYAEPLSLMVIDADDFARVNDSGGHMAGDEMLVGFARLTESAVRTRDVVCRAGGDEAVIILPGTDSDTALAIAERILGAIREVLDPNGRRMTASIGIASLPGQASERSELVSRAEAALYWAKTHGKDRAVVFDPEVVVEGNAEERARVLQERADHAMVRALAAAVDARDEKTQDHSRSVARYAVALARESGLDERTTLLVEYAALLHDVGKIGVADALLRKSGALTAEERASMESHAELGEAILSSTTMREILPWIRHHHERWDGTGYPDHLSGEDIPLGARILALANAYDAMRSDRPHRAAMSRSAALQELDLGLGTAFDPELGERFIDAVGRTPL
jgi:diguanylate cyclase (GGDEF)-like protein/putative nucleotidyltransferase with HDIG domain